MLDSRKLMILKNLKKSKELKLKEFNSGKLTWDSKFTMKDWVRPVTLNIFMVKGFFCYPLPISMMSQRANQSFWYRTLPPTSPRSYRRDGPFICYLLNSAPGEASDLACPKQSSSSFYPNLPFFFSLQQVVLPTTDTWALSRTPPSSSSPMSRPQSCYFYLPNPSLLNSPTFLYLHGLKIQSRPLSPK